MKSRCALEAGKLADLVVLDRSFYGCTNEELKHMQPLSTMVGGRVVYARGAFAGSAR